MSKFKLIADSSCDLTPELLKIFQIDVVPFYITLNGIDYLKEGVDISQKDFFEFLIASATPSKTSLPSIADYTAAFEPYLKQGTDIICICLTAKFSGSYQSAVNAANILSEEYPQREIIVVDSRLATGSQGLLAIEAARMAQANFSAQEALSKINRLRETSYLAFTVDNLEHLQRGGRIGKASALIGSLLNIKPIITLANGELIPHSKVRGRKKALNQISSIIADFIGNNQEEYRFSVLGFEGTGDAEEMWQSFSRHTGIAEPDFVCNIGATIGTHSGPTATGITCIKKYTALD